MDLFGWLILLWLLGLMRVRWQSWFLSPEILLQIPVVCCNMLAFFGGKVHFLAAMQERGFFRNLRGGGGLSKGANWANFCSSPWPCGAEELVPPGQEKKRPRQALERPQSVPKKPDFRGPISPRISLKIWGLSPPPQCVSPRLDFPTFWIVQDTALESIQVGGEGLNTVLLGKISGPPNPPRFAQPRLRGEMRQIKHTQICSLTPGKTSHTGFVPSRGGDDCGLTYSSRLLCKFGWAWSSLRAFPIGKLAGGLSCLELCGSKL